MAGFSGRPRQLQGRRQILRLLFAAARRARNSAMSPGCLFHQVLLENLLRFEDGVTVTGDDIQGSVVHRGRTRRSEREIQYRPARVLMQDFTGVPAVVDLAAMRDAWPSSWRSGEDQPARTGRSRHRSLGDGRCFPTPSRSRKTVALEYSRNMECHEFLKWSQSAFRNFEVVPPGTWHGHQVNLEYIARALWSFYYLFGEEVAYPDTLTATRRWSTASACSAGALGGIEPGRRRCSASRSRC